MDILYHKPAPATYYPIKRKVFISSQEFNNILTARTFSLQIAKANFEVIISRLGEAKEDVESYLGKN